MIHINYIAANGHICFCSQHWLSSAHCVNCMSTIPFFHQMYTPYTQFVYFSPLRQICTQRIALYLSHCIHTQTHTSIHPVSQSASQPYVPHVRQPHTNTQLQAQFIDLPRHTDTIYMFVWFGLRVYKQSTHSKRGSSLSFAQWACMYAFHVICVCTWQMCTQTVCSLPITLYFHVSLGFSSSLCCLEPYTILRHYCCLSFNLSHTHVCIVWPVDKRSKF